MTVGHSRLRLVRILAVVSVMIVADAVHAQSAPGPAESKPGDGGILAGPKVEPEAQHEGDGQMNPQGQRTQRQVEVPFVQWMRMVRQLELTDEQKSKTDAVAAEFRQAQDDFTDAQGEEGRELFREARKARQSGERLSPEQRQKMRAIEEGRPKPGPYQERIWAELTEAQQGELKQKLDQARQRMSQARDRRAETADDSMDNFNSRRRKAAEDQSMTDKPSEPTTMESSDGSDDAAPPAPQRRRWQRRGDQIKLDEIGQRRLKFLLSRQSADAREKHPTGEPAPAERQFQFDEPQPGDDHAEQPEQRR
ncbi:MAG: hypothetical protein L0Y44_13055 [Phycisphaerales bacterium]|nr:hypothetical protein [Phycisphaerales bacterium]MCI0631572.1 hypothetical protein [Phycisphaerales bacterium]MCI0675271.1 hypothetical protein [Phycisphaerales bacterium]